MLETSLKESSDGQRSLGPGPDEGEWLAGLLQALARLDGLLERAVAAVQAERGAHDEPFRAVLVTCDEVERLLARPPATPFAGPPAAPTTRAFPLGWLEQAHGLSPFDTDALVVALAPELDLRYERLYAYLQDDPTRRRPTVELVLRLLCSTPHERLLRRARFAPDAPLVKSGLVRLLGEPQESLLSAAVAPDPQVVRLVVGDLGLDERIAAFSRLHAPGRLPAAPVADARGGTLARAAVDAAERGEPIRLCLHGPDAALRRAAVGAIAGALGAAVLEVDLQHTDDGSADALAVAAREAHFRGAILLLENADALLAPERLAHALRVDAIVANAPVGVLISGDAPWVLPGAPVSITAVEFGLPGFERRRESWSRALRATGTALAAADLDALAERFRLSVERIGAAADMAAEQAAWRRGGAGGGATAAEVFAAARRHAGQPPAALATRVEVLRAWEDLVLAPERLAQLREICDRATYGHVVHDRWGLGRRSARGRGLSALFSGVPGTGKTMAAGVVARELRLDLYRVDISQVVSKYIGETEKHLAQIFDAARTSSAVLLFDEADALFASRSDVRDAHDRYANVETGYLLQRMEEHDGIVVLATNLRQNLDEAFLRRLDVVIEFPLPEADERRRIWETSLPPEAPLADDVDFSLLAARYAFAGGNIANAAVTAAFAAAARDERIGLAHLERAARRELRKLGRVFHDDGGGT